MDLKLFDAIRSGELQRFHQLADAERNVYGQETPEGNTVLHMAARYGHTSLVKVIIERKRQLVLKSNIKGETPVHIAARAGHLHVITFFIESVKKFSIHIAGTRDNNGNTPLHGAIRNGHLSVVTALAGHDKNALLEINDAGESALSIAIDMRFTEIANSIISSNPSTLGLAGPNGRTALHCAVIRQDFDTLTAIWERKKDLGKKQDEKKRTPLHYAVALGLTKMVEHLLSKDPSVAYMEDNNKQIPLHLAAETGHIGLLKTLLAHCPDTIEIVDKMERNILHIAANTGNLNMVSHILRLDGMEDLVNSRDANGNTPLHLATKNYHIDVVGVLCQNQKVEIRSINDSKKTALAIAKLPDERGMELQKHLTLKTLKRAYKQKGIDPEEFLENMRLDATEVEKASKEIEKGRQMAKMISLMATLIATFTFTAAFTIPGGFKDAGKDAGTAILSRKGLFMAFVIFDAIAMASSITAAAIVFWSASIKAAEFFMDILSAGIGLTWISLVAVILAFATGLSAVLHKTLWLAVVVCLISCVAPLFLYLAPLYTVIKRDSVSPTFTACGFNMAQDNPFLFIVRLIKLYIKN